MYKLSLNLLILSALVSSAFALEKVYVTKSGKHYHVYRSCSALKKAKNVSTLPSTTAKSRKMNMCELCKAVKRKANSKTKSGSHSQ